MNVMTEEEAKGKRADIRCVCCGRFVGLDEIASRRARYFFRPDSVCGPELNDWTCARCVESEGRPTP